MTAQDELIGRHLAPSSAVRLVSATGAHASAVAIARHLEWMRLRGLAADSIYQRGRGLARLAAALPVPLLEADAAMLAAWRAALTVTPAVICTYVGETGGKRAAGTTRPAVI